MEAMREAWTDERLDDLTQRVDRGFDRIDDRFDSLQRMLLAGYVTAVLGLIATQL